MGVALSYVLWAIADSFTVFVIARIVGGLAKGNVSLSTAVVADVYDVKERGKGMVSTAFILSLPAVASATCIQTE